MRTALVMLTTCLFVLPAQVGVSAAEAAPAAQMDQSNVPPWAGGWTHVNPDGEGGASMWQTFTPGRPNLTAVAIDILTIGPGRGDDVLTVEIAREGVVLISAAWPVIDGFEGLLRVEFPATVPLVPEQTYELKVRDTGKTCFGWKYASNTYERGTRYVFGQPRPGTDWLFQTYSEGEPAMTKYSGGTGEPNDPYQIATAADLIALGATPADYDKHFVLTADIDLDPNLLGGKVFDKAVIAPNTNDVQDGFQGISFTGAFDGNDHTISHLMIRGGSYLGLWGLLEAKARVRDLRLRDVDIMGFDYVGGLAGFSRGQIASSDTTGTVRGERRVGGLVGRNWGTIAAARSTAAVTAQEDAGGLAANNYGSIANSYSTGTVTAHRDAGGLVGENYGSVIACYSRGAVAGSMRVGGLVGYNWADADVHASFWDTQTSGQMTSAAGTGLTTTEMQNGETFRNAGWDFIDEVANGTDDPWWILEGKDYPRLWWEARN